MTTEAFTQVARQHHPSPNDIKEFLVAARVGDTQLLKNFILVYGANIIDAPDPIIDEKSKGETALIMAVVQDNIECVNELLQAGADPDTQDRGGWTALFHATWNFRLECISLLIEAGADMDHQDRNGQTALMWAASQSGVICSFSLLLEYGSNINIRNPQGDTALAIALSSDNEPAIELLHEKQNKLDSDIAALSTGTQHAIVTQSGALKLQPRASKGFSC